MNNTDEVRAAQSEDDWAEENHRLDKKPDI